MAADREEPLHPEPAREDRPGAWRVARRWGRRVAFVDLEGAGRSVELEERVAAHARLGGAALALAPFTARAVETAAPVFTLAVGEAVERGVPTAARVTVAARAPLRPGVTEAQCGGPFASDLAALLDGLVISGAAKEPVHLVIGEDGVRALPGAARAASLSARTREALEHGGAALVVGPAADVGLSFANIASVGGARRRASSGAAVSARRSGRPASCRSWSRRAPGRRRRGQLAAALGRSPLLERARGRTLGSPRTAAPPVSARRGRRPPRLPRLPDSVRLGAPAGGRAPPGHRTLRGDAGLRVERRGGPLHRRCGELGMDARSAARLVRDLGREAELPGVLDELVERGGRPRGSRARASGDESRPMPCEADLAARVGVVASPRGPEPMRSLSIFDLAPGVDTEIALTGDAAENAGSSRGGTGPASAVDISGFCAFSAAALVADGVLGVDELARAISPTGGWDEGGDPGAAAMIAAGAALAAPGARRGWPRERVEGAGEALRHALGPTVGSLGRSRSPSGRLRRRRVNPRGWRPRSA